MADQSVVAAVAALLMPFLPELTTAGEEAAKVVGRKAGETACRFAVKLWQLIWPKAQSDPEMNQAVQEALQSPRDEDRLMALEECLQKLLARDHELAQKLSQIVAEARQAGAVTMASGERSVAIGRDVSGGTIVTGDGNAVP